MRLTILAATATVMALPAVGQTYNPVAQFGVKHNPNGAWSYLADGMLLSKTLKSCAGVSGFNCWWTGESQPSSGTIGGNRSADTVSYDTIRLPAHTISLDPEYASPAVVQWTAPSAGTATITGNFMGVDTDEASHSVAVLHDGTALATYTVAHYQQKQKFRFTVAVQSGDTIGFANYAQGWTYLTTGLQARIALAPE
jgi:hypothetical protein